MANVQNPYSAGFAAVAAVLSGFAPFMAALKGRQNNLRNPQAAGYQPKTNSNLTDRIEVLIGEGRIAYRNRDNSRYVKFECSYPLQVATASFNPDDMNLVAVTAMQAFETATDPYLGLPELVYEWELAAPGRAALRDPQTNRPEWSVVLEPVLRMAMDRAIFKSAVFT